MFDGSKMLFERASIFIKRNDSNTFYMYHFNVMLQQFFSFNENKQ